MRTRSFSVPLVPTAMRGPWASDLGNEWFEAGVNPLLESLAIALRRRIVADALGRQSADAEQQARRPPQSGRIADHQLDAASADVDAERGRRIDDNARTDGREHEPRLLDAADDLDIDAGLGLDPVDELAAVRGGADRARRLRR